MRVSPGCLWPFYTHADLSPRTYLFNGSQLAKDIRPLFRDTPDVDSMKEYGLDLSSYVMRDFRCEHACKGVRETQPRVRIQSSPPASLTFSLSGWRSARKLDFAAQNGALRADATESAVCGYLALIALAGLVINTVWKVRWADPAAALALVPLIVRGGWEARKGKPCCH